MRYEFHGPDEIGSRVWSKWVAQRIPGCERGWDACAVMRVHDGTRTLGCVVFHDYSPENDTICLSAAADGPWLNRGVLTAMHEYVFDTARCQAAVSQTSENNHRINRIMRAVGYTGHRIPRLRGRDEAEMIWVLTDDEWRHSKFRRR